MISTKLLAAMAVLAALSEQGLGFMLSPSAPQLLPQSSSSSSSRASALSQISMKSVRPSRLPRVPDVPFDPTREFAKVVDEMFPSSKEDIFPAATAAFQKYMDGNEQFIKDSIAKQPDCFKKMAQGQAPKFLWIGCSDARIPPNEIVGLGPGDMMVHRNVANQVIHTDGNAMAVIQFCTEYLKVENIIVSGHYECGGVKAACANNDHHAPLENWIRNIRDTQRIHKKTLDAIKDPDAKHRKLVDLNTLEQALNVYKAAVVQRRRAYTYARGEDIKPRIFAVTVDPKTGELKDLGFDPKSMLEEDDLESVYKLYDAEAAKKAYGDKNEPYNPRPATWRKRRNYNRVGS